MVVRFGLLFWTSALSLGMASAEADSHPLHTAHFVFEPDEGTAGVAERLAEVAEQKRQYVLSVLGTRDERTITVRIASSDEAMSRMAGVARPVREWIAGLAFSDRALIVLSARGNEVFQVTDTFEHELAHLYLDTAIRGRPVPRWFHEGVAMLIASEGVSERLKTAMGAAASGAWLPLADLESSFPGEAPAVHLAYAQAMLLVRSLTRRSPGNLPELIARVADGMPFETAFEQTFGAPVEAVWEQAKQQVGRTRSLIWFLTSAAVLWVVITGLFLYVYSRKRRRASLKRQAWEIQEELARIQAWHDSDPKDIQ